ncbi:hypothetical protein K435DRAFT_787492 [Dendrothele bispora CBS 962.96]|uniref:Uncharacterized protein n=1 Tax=Dendrothele bispora (strain CBS 962.96) TaxID=1314807 RepID=A0A4S8KKS4_DENBC|nr:hypothetical protein K435DRAFT_787492 [Dendrothele bispora CBS 962.96]
MSIESANESSLLPPPVLPTQLILLFLAFPPKSSKRDNLTKHTLSSSPSTGVSYSLQLMHLPKPSPSLSS